jgi:trimethylamine:corrinoid methyltransferase-like protein
VEYARRFLKSSHFNEETLSTDIIKEVVEEGRGDFLSHQSTVDNFRDAFWIPELFEHYTLRQWQAKGAKPILDRVKEIAKRRISEHHFELERNVQNELNKIYKKASESLIR